MLTLSGAFDNDSSSWLDSSLYSGVAVFLRHFPPISALQRANVLLESDEPGRENLNE